MSDGLSLRLPIRRASIGRAVEAVEAFMAGHALPVELIQTICLVMDEVLVNIVTYAHRPPDDSKEMTVEAGIADGELRLTASDDGMPFDPLSARPPDTEADLDDRRVGGLGIMLVTELMDSVQYRREHGRNHLTLTKAIPSVGGA